MQNVLYRFHANQLSKVKLTQKKKLKQSLKLVTLKKKAETGKNQSQRAKRKSVLTVAQQELFDRFYASYPKKQDRASAEKAWARIEPQPDEQMTEQIIEAIEQSKKYDSRFRAKQFTPLPASWLNAKGYLNEFMQEEETDMKIMTADLKREQYQSTSSHQEDSRASIDLVTPQEAKERGLKFRIQPPQTQICKYCGKEVYPTGVVIQGMVFLWKPTLRCKCEKALAYWKAYDQRQAAEKAARKEEEEQRARRERIDRLIGMSGIKKRFQQRTFPNFVTDTQGRKRSYQTAKEYADNFAQHKAQGDGLYIEGTNGTGKTHLAAAIALQLINEGIPVICKTANYLILRRHMTM